MKHRVCVSWFENGEPKERGFRVPYRYDDAAWFVRVRAAELKAEAKGDKSDGATVFSTSLDGETTHGFYIWSDEKNTYDYHELG